MLAIKIETNYEQAQNCQRDELLPADAQGHDSVPAYRRPM